MADQNLVAIHLQGKDELAPTLQANVEQLKRFNAEATAMRQSLQTLGAEVQQNTEKQLAHNRALLAMAQSADTVRAAMQAQRSALLAENEEFEAIGGTLGLIIKLGQGIQGVLGSIGGTAVDTALKWAGFRKELTESEKATREFIASQNNLAGVLDQALRNAGTGARSRGQTVQDALAMQRQHLLGGEFSHQPDTLTLPPSAVISTSANAFQTLASGIKNMASGLLDGAKAIVNWETANEKEYARIQALIQSNAQYSRSLEEVAQEQRVNQAITEQSTSAYSALESAVLAVGATFTTGFVISKVSDFISQVVEATRKYDGLTAQIAAQVGGQREAAQVLQTLFEMSQRLGVETANLTERYRQLNTVTRGTTLAGDETRRLLEALAAASTNARLSQEGMNRVIDVAAGMLRKATVSLEDLHRLEEALPGALDTASRAMDTSTQSLENMAKQGDLLTEVFLLRFGREVIRNLNDATWQGVRGAESGLQQLSNAWQDFLRCTGAMSSGWFDNLYKWAAGTLNKLAETSAALQKQVAADAQKMTLYLPGGQRQAGSIEGATPAEIDELQRLTYLQQSYRKPEGSKNVLDWARYGFSGAPFMSDFEVDDFVHHIEMQKRKILDAIAKRQQPPPANIAQPSSETPEETYARKQTEAAHAAIVANKQLEEVLQQSQQTMSNLSRSAKLTPEVFGSEASTAEEHIEFYTRKIAALRQELTKITETELHRPSEAGAIPEAMRQQKAALQKDLRDAEDQLEAIQDAQRKAEEAKRRAEQEAERLKNASERFLSQQRQNLARQSMTREEGEEAILREQAAQEGLSKAVTEQGVALLKQAQAARIAKEELEAWNKQMKEARQEWARQGDLLGLEVAPEVEKARKEQTEYNKVLEDTLRVLNAPTAERLGQRLRNRAPGGVLTLEQEGKINEIDAKEKALQQAKDIEQIFRATGREVDSIFEDLWGSIFGQGVSSARQFGIKVVQDIQRLMTSITFALIQQMIRQATGTTAAEGGVGGALAKGLIKFVGGLIGGAAGGGTSAAVTSTAQGYDYSGAFTGGADTGAFAMGGIISLAQSGLRLRSSVGLQALSQRFADIGAPLQPLALAGGGVVRQPSIALIGENLGHHEAVVPLPDNRSIPVSFTQRPQQMQPDRPIVIQLHQDFSGAIDPRTLRTPHSEIIGVVAKDVSTDGQLRRVIMQHSR